MHEYRYQLSHLAALEAESIFRGYAGQVASGVLKPDTALLAVSRTSTIVDGLPVLGPEHLLAAYQPASG